MDSGICFVVTTYESSPDDLQKLLEEEARHGPSTKIADISVRDCALCFTSDTNSHVHIAFVRIFSYKNRLAMFTYKQRFSFKWLKYTDAAVN